MAVRHNVSLQNFQKLVLYYIKRDTNLASGLKFLLTVVPTTQQWDNISLCNCEYITHSRIIYGRNKLSKATSMFCTNIYYYLISCLQYYLIIWMQFTIPLFRHHNSSARLFVRRGVTLAVDPTYCHIMLVFGRCFQGNPRLREDKDKALPSNNCLPPPPPDYKWCQQIDYAILVDLREIGCEGVDWIHPAQDRVHWRALVNSEGWNTFPNYSTT
jgi:hypothetical protein